MTRHLDRDDAGFSLVELLVVMMVFGVLSALVTATVINAMGGSRRTQERTYRSADVQKSLEVISKDVRVAIPVTAAAADDLSVRVYRNGACHLRRWSLDPVTKTVTETTRTYPVSTSCGTATGTPGAATSRVLLRNVENSAAAPLFSFYRLDAAGVRTPMTSLPVASGDLRKIQGVVVDLRVAGPEGGRPVHMQTSVELRNG